MATEFSSSPLGRAFISSILKIYKSNRELRDKDISDQIVTHAKSKGLNTKAIPYFSDKAVGRVIQGKFVKSRDINDYLKVERFLFRQTKSLSIEALTAVFQYLPLFFGKETLNTEQYIKKKKTFYFFQWNENLTAKNKVIVGEIDVTPLADLAISKIETRRKRPNSNRLFRFVGVGYFDKLDQFHIIAKDTLTDGFAYSVMNEYDKKHDIGYATGYLIKHHGKTNAHHTRLVFDLKDHYKKEIPLGEIGEEELKEKIMQYLKTDHKII